MMVDLNLFQCCQKAARCDTSWLYKREGILDMVGHWERGVRSRVEGRRRGRWDRCSQTCSVGTGLRGTSGR